MASGHDTPGAAPACGILTIVGTPIGNLDDLSPRAADALGAADVVYAEDTRVTGRLLAHLGVHVELERCDENVIARRTDEVLSRVREGQRVAFASDAGMPGISDPGRRLVDAALDAGLPVEVVPGPTAAATAVAASGLACERFFFEGFLPRKASQRRDRLERLASIPGALVIYESPQRVAATLAEIAAVMPARRVALCRELTKLHEEVVRGTAGEVAAEVASRERVLGECVVVVEAPSEDELASRAMPEAAAVPLEEAIRAGLEDGVPKSELAKRLARERGLDRGTVYNQIVSLAREEPLA
jgi:16S rRNA (cytidine1402-2'-O)-methyltransferase